MFLKSLSKLTQFNLGLGCAKDGAPHYESVYTSMNPNETNNSTSFLKISSCTFVTRYDCKHIGFVSSFNLKSTGSVFQVPSIPSTNP